MRAIIVADKNRAGIGTVETPTPVAGEIRVGVKAVALNRADLLVLAGHQHGSVGGAGAILGLECAGEVESLGQDVAGFAIGDRVMCSARHAMAEYAVTDAGRATKIPGGMSFEEATTLPVALQTMHDALMTNGRLKKGESVLVQGASSGVGLMALKIAKLMGAGLVIGSDAPNPSVAASNRCAAPHTSRQSNLPAFHAPLYPHRYHLCRYRACSPNRSHRSKRWSAANPGRSAAGSPRRALGAHSGDGRPSRLRYGIWTRWIKDWWRWRGNGVNGLLRLCVFDCHAHTEDARAPGHKKLHRLHPHCDLH
jgi:hypothetical protein